MPGANVIEGMTVVESALVGGLLSLGENQATMIAFQMVARRVVRVDHDLGRYYSDLYYLIGDGPSQGMSLAGMARHLATYYREGNKP